MKRFKCLGLTWMLLTMMATVAVAGDERFNEKRLLDAGFTPLLNGEDLSGWKVPEGDGGHWKVVDAVIDYDAKSEAKGNKSLFTEQEFGNYMLHLEWRFKRTSGLYAMRTILPSGDYKTGEDGKPITTPAPNADSGILLRGPRHQANLWCWPCGSGELWGTRNNKSLPAEVRAAAVPKVNADNPVGEWNRMVITMTGDRVTIMENGKKVIDNAQIPGIPEQGPIGFQHHGGPLSSRQIAKLKEEGSYKEGDPEPMSPASSLIQFRRIYIKPLESPESP
ncbi:MAG: DUF1080 domain-containing protein [Planctomycetes bacterium]|nr:DUF1080 domain-containing protein [Planctomycetota bacterium]MBL7037544.1 DUF1080 domain-containing protein [Pirellulaceae bacterium]